MLCSNCGYEKDNHVPIDSKLLCLQREGVFTTRVDRYDCEIIRKGTDGKNQTINTAILEADTSRLHNTIMRSLEQGYADITVTVVDHKLREVKKAG